MKNSIETIESLNKTFYLVVLFIFNSFVIYATATVGLASWYGEDFHGKLTANGERFDMTDLTAAHKSLTFNTIVRVTNLLNNRSITVRINDRGPFRKDRIIDLSKAAAQKLDFLGTGVAPVKLEVIEVGKTIAKKDNLESGSLDNSNSNNENTISNDSKQSSNILSADGLVDKEKAKVDDNIQQKIDFFIQIGSYKNKTYAIRVYNVLKSNNLNVFVNHHQPYFTVYVPTSHDKVAENVKLIKSSGYKEVLVRQTPVPGQLIDLEQ